MVAVRMSKVVLFVAFTWGICTVPGKAEPPGTGWTKTFEDNFEGEALDLSKWATEAGAGWAGIQSSRWPENVSVKSGELLITTKKENKAGKNWTTGQVMTRDFRQKGGYFEVKMKIAPAEGIDNAFWLTGKNFEIDVAEVFFPNKILMSTHDFKKRANKSSDDKIEGSKLSDEYHVYGLLWLDDQLTWYFDGNEVAHQRCDFCDEAAALRISTAVVDWAGSYQEDKNTETSVDWVRVYQK